MELHLMLINPETFLDTLLMEIRRESIIFSSVKKKNREAKELLIVNDIEKLESEIINISDELFQECNNKLHTKKSELEEIIDYQAQGAMIRARARYAVEGEKPSKLFCSLEKHNAVQKHIPSLIIDQNGIKREINEQKMIENETYKYYSDLFAQKPTEIENLSQFFPPEVNQICPKLSQRQKDSMEGLLTLVELTNYIKKAKNNVAPGTAGFKNEFFKFFWIDLK